MTVDHEHALGAKTPGHLGHDRREPRIVDAQELPLGTCGVGERPQNVEDGPNPDLATHRTRMSHARVQRLGEQEADTGLVDAARHVVRHRV